MSHVYSHSDGAFSLTLPDDWDYALQKRTIAFFQPETGVGAINVSAMVPARDPVDLAGMALEFTPKSIRAGLRATELDSTVPGAYVDYEFKSDAWGVWAFCGRTRAIILSYNCPVSFKRVEDSVVDEIVRSLVVG